MEFGILGPLAVTNKNRPSHVGGPKLRRLLAALLVHANEVVSADYLASVLWPGDAADSRHNALHTQISRLRAIVDAHEEPHAPRLVSRGHGYILRVGEGELDADVFETLSDRCRAALATADWHRALDAADESLECWRGPALDGFEHEPFAQAHAVKLEERRLLVVECRIEAAIALGRHRELVSDLRALVDAHPLRESLWYQLVLALYRSGRQTDALRAYEQVRRLLADELGLKPGAALAHLERLVLAQDSSLEWQPGPKPTTVSARAAPDQLETATAQRPDPARPHNLPVQLTSFVGRKAEQAAIAEILDIARLVTLSGSGGCGKTRIAVAVAEALLPRFPDGAYFADLSAISDAALIPRAVAQPLGVETDQADQMEQLCRRIGDGQLLLVLDNCEHLVAAVADMVEELLLHCRSLHILATSREELRLGAEAVWRVPALSLPLVAGADSPRDRFLHSEAVELFVERGGSALRSFAPTGAALDAVAQICRRLDGLPLAIELAAALVGRLPLAEIAERLDDRFRLLTQGRRHAVERHRTLRATLDWSFDLLDSDVQALFDRLGVFVGDFTLEAAETIARNESDASAVVRGLSHLVATSMVSCIAGSEGTERYRMLETVRQYALERLDRLDCAEEIHTRHARYYAEYAAEAERHVHGPAASQWLVRLSSELPNLRAAVTWAISHDDIAACLQLAGGSLPWYFARMSLLDEASQWLDALLTSTTELPAGLRLKALTAASTAAFMHGKFSRSGQLGDEAISIGRKVDDARQMTIALIVRGASAVYEGQLDRADECFEEASGLCSRLGNRWGTAWLLSCRAVGSRRAGQLGLARHQLQESLEIFRSLDDRHGQVLPLVNLAIGALQEGQIDEGLEFAGEALRMATELGDRPMQHVALCVLGRVEMALGHLGSGRDLLLRSIRQYHGAHNQIAVIFAMEGLAGLSSSVGRHSEAAVLLGFVRQLRDQGRIWRSTPRAREHDAWLDAATSAIGADRVAQAVDRGRATSLDDAVDLAEAATNTFAAGAELLRT